MEFSYNKYLKYKYKYLNLKNILGAGKNNESEDLDKSHKREFNKNILINLLSRKLTSDDIIFITENIKKIDETYFINTKVDGSTKYSILKYIIDNDQHAIIKLLFENEKIYDLMIKHMMTFNPIIYAINSYKKDCVNVILNYLTITEDWYIYYLNHALNIYKSTISSKKEDIKSIVYQIILHIITDYNKELLKSIFIESKINPSEFFKDDSYILNVLKAHKLISS